MKKSRAILLIATLLIWAGMYYYYLPALNIHSEESWMFFVVAILVGLALNFWPIFKMLFLERDGIAVDHICSVSIECHADAWSIVGCVKHIKFGEIDSHLLACNGRCKTQSVAMIVMTMKRVVTFLLT